MQIAAELVHNFGGQCIAMDSGETGGVSELGSGGDHVVAVTMCRVWRPPLPTLLPPSACVCGFLYEDLLKLRFTNTGPWRQ